jgi:hypothetical protein
MTARDPCVTRLLLPGLAQRLQDQALHIEATMSALGAVGDLARCISVGREPSAANCSELSARSLAGLASVLAHQLEVSVQQLDLVVGELERAA